MEDGVDISFSELFTKAVFCWGWGGEESGKTEGLRPLQSYKFYIKLLDLWLNYNIGRQRVMSFVISWPLVHVGKNSSL